MDIKLNLSNQEHKELVAYCNLNDLLISSVVKDSFTTGFNIERYGLLNPTEGQIKEVEKEVIIEKTIEVPVEVVKEVVKEIVKVEYVDRIVEKPIEIVKEIPVEKVVIKEVIKEVPVEKIVYVTDQQELNEKIFQKDQEIDQQRKLFSNKTEELENNFQKEKNELLSRIKELENREPEVREVVREVTKEVVDTSKNQMLQETIQKLRSENIEKDKKIKELELQKDSLIASDLQRGAVYLRGSNLNDTLYK